jgi:23S rRNA (cytidine1920-2'-O)/16S rRNA (cytidine1409-2'-O)-methyltransferase
VRHQQFYGFHRLLTGVISKSSARCSSEKLISKDCLFKGALSYKLLTINVVTGISSNVAGQPIPSNTRARLDQVMVERGLCPSREKAKRAIMAGQVTINDQRAHKPSDTVGKNDQVTLLAPEKFVSRGGAKLEHAILHFPVGVRGTVAIDLGASTGGFTDCLLQHGAAKVYAVDVGQGQLAWKLRRDPRVVVMEKVNARTLSRASFPAPFAPVDLVVIDCSFISLRKIIPTSIALLRPSGKIIALIKPQFEAGKAEADKGAGVIRDPEIHQRVLSELAQFAATLPELRWVGTTPSPVLGPAGNREFLALLERIG